MTNIIRENIETLTMRACNEGMNFQTLTERLLDIHNGRFYLKRFVPVGGCKYDTVYINAVGDRIEVRYWERECGELVLDCLEVIDSREGR